MESRMEDIRGPRHSTSCFSPTQAVTVAFFWRSCRNPSVAQNPQAVDFQERDFIVRATDFLTVKAAVASLAVRLTIAS